MYDLIGDIHGHADKLESLLTKLGYSKRKGAYTHPGRKVIFVGDLIDRGPKIRETLQLVRSMVDSGNAIALMGNHEYNALCFHMQETEGGHVRKHLIKNIIQHYETLNQFQNRQQEYEEYLDWFLTMPLFYETDDFRVVHACWDSNNINYLREILPDCRLTEELIFESSNKESRLHSAIEETLKGKEISLPPGSFFTDKYGFRRTEIRVKWWEDSRVSTYKSISVEPILHLPDTSVDFSHFSNLSFYPETEKSVFFGHYWLKGQPSFFKKNVCCLDYSVANGGVLVGYVWDEYNGAGKNNLVWV